MLSKDIWYEAATRANLRVGQRRRFKHSCGDGDVVLVTSETFGLSAYCFRCDDRAVIKRELSLAEQAEQLRARTQSHAEFRACQIPSDYTLDIPQEYAVWLYKASIRKAQARALGIGWSPSMQRILLPVYQDDVLVYVQARAVKSGQKPKYLNTAGRHAGRAVFQTEEITSSTEYCICTEDMLSAVRTGKFAPSVSLCGVAVNYTKLQRFIAAKIILVWLDPDPAGRKGMQKFIKAVSLLHRDVRMVHSPKDPKLLTDEEIQHHITGALHAT